MYGRVNSKEENEAPGWTQPKLPGQQPSPRCGHTMTSGGHNLLLFGGHVTGGWLSRYDVYHNNCIVLDRVSVQWKCLPTSNESPLDRAYHTMTAIGSHYLLFGGFDEKSTYDDPIARRLTSPPSNNTSESNSVSAHDVALQSPLGIILFMRHAYAITFLVLVSDPLHKVASFSFSRSRPASLHILTGLLYMQAYYPPGMIMPPPPYYNPTIASGHPPHPFMWGTPRGIMAPYGSPYWAMYAHGGV